MVTSLDVIPISVGTMEIMANSTGPMVATFPVMTFVMSRAGVKIVAVFALPIRNAPISPGEVMSVIVILRRPRTPWQVRFLQLKQFVDGSMLEFQMGNKSYSGLYLLCFSHFIIIIVPHAL